MKQRYLETLSPWPIPALTVRLGPVGEARQAGPLTAIVDTGADVTIIPVSILRQLKIRPVGSGRLRSAWEQALAVKFYLIDLEISGHVFPGVQVAGADSLTSILLGRNILNKLPLLLDGPDQHSAVVDEALIKRLRIQTA